MTFTKKILASAVILATSSLAIAVPVTDSTTVEINVTKDSYVNLTGSLAGNVIKTVTPAALAAGTVTLGTLGFNSNTTGTCTVTFASANNYSLVHTVDGALNLGTYSISYGGVTNTAGTTNSWVSPTCNTATDSNFTMTNGALPAVITAGTYSDVLTMVVTTQ